MFSELFLKSKTVLRISVFHKKIKTTIPYCTTQTYLCNLSYLLTPTAPKRLFPAPLKILSHYLATVSNPVPLIFKHRHCTQTPDTRLPKSPPPNKKVVFLLNLAHAHFTDYIVPGFHLIVAHSCGLPWAADLEILVNLQG